MSSEDAHKSIFLKIETPQMLRRAAVMAKHRNGMSWATPSGRGFGKVTRGLNYIAILDELREVEGDLWEFTAKHIDRSVYFRPVWSGTKIPAEVLFSGTHYAEQAGWRFDHKLLDRYILHQSPDKVVMDHMAYYEDTMNVILSTGRQHGKDYTLKKLADKMMSDEAYEAMRYKTIVPPWLYDQGVEMFGEDRMSGALPYSPGPWNNREEKQEAFRRHYGLPDMSKIYGDPLEGSGPIEVSLYGKPVLGSSVSTGRFATNARKD